MIPRENPDQPRGLAARRPRRDMLTSGKAAALILVAFWILMVAALWHKSLTYDEVAHATAGYSYWHYDDYRLQPENGQLPQRLAGLPMALGLAPLPAPLPTAWHNAEQWEVGSQWIYGSGRDAAALGAEGRLACGLFAVALGALVWAWSRRLFGPGGAMISLLLFVLSPTVLANGALMTSDMASALFFATVAGAFWAVLNRLSAGRLVLSTTLLGALFLTKASALLMLPIAAILIAARLADGRPWVISAGPLRREIAPRWRQAAAFTGLVALHGLVVVAMIWASYGFRYSAFAVEDGRFRMPWQYLLAKPAPVRCLLGTGLSEAQKSRMGALLSSRGVAGDRWSNAAVDAVSAMRQEVLSPEQVRRFDAAQALPSPTLWVRAIEISRVHQLLPEAWLYGLADVLRRSQVRAAFLNGDFRLRGWWWFFPYTFLVKTPLAVWALFLLALAAVPWGRLRRLGPPAWAALYPSLPLWVFLVVYWAAALATHLNIGHRHLLPVYAPLFILCGVLGRWIAGSGRKRRIWVVAGLLALLAVETATVFPDYLAYFNGIVSSRDAYRHLVDSSLDWGQDLPSVPPYIGRAKPAATRFYFSYFGTASPDYYRINAHLLYSIGSQDALRRQDWKTFFLDAETFPTRVASLTQEWPDYDLIGAQRLENTVVVVLLKKPSELRLGPGTYLISASMLQPVNFYLDGPWGPWNARYEATYQELRAAVEPLASGDDVRRRSALMQRSSREWPDLLKRFEAYRFGRLTAYLRAREPDDEIHSSILVYRLGAPDLEQALEGPPPAYGPDDLAAQAKLLPGTDGE